MTNALDHEERFLRTQLTMAQKVLLDLPPEQPIVAG
jgi:hypothetical protein